MHKIGKALLLLCSLTSAGEIAAQTVSGKLIDENKQPLPYANVVLLSLPDSTFVTGTVTAEDGTFSLNTTTPNQLVRISSIGYNTVYKPVQPANLGVIQLTSDTQQLGEVVVKADLPKIRVKGDAMVTTVAGSIIRKTKCFDFWERNVLFPKTKRSFFRTPTPLPCPFPLNFSLLIITKKFGNLAKNRYICIV